MKTTPIDIKALSDDLVSYLEMARLAMDTIPESLAEHMDMDEDEVARLSGNLNTVMSTTTVTERAAIITSRELEEIGRGMWYSVTDDDCRLRGGGPEMFASHLMRKIFPPISE